MSSRCTRAREFKPNVVSERGKYRRVAVPCGDTLSVNNPLEESAASPHESGPAVGPLRAIANRCTAGSCPTIYQPESNGETVIVQGFVVPVERAGVAVPEGEALVEIPYKLLAEALRNLA